MPRTPDRKQKGFIWFPRDDVPEWDLKIDGTSQKTKIWTAECTRAASPEIGSFKIILDNNNEEFTDKYEKGDTVQFYMDLVDGDTKRFEGKIDRLENSYDQGKGSMLRVEGGHLSSELTAITVTKSYEGDKTCDEILKEIIDEYAASLGYTYTNVSASTVKPSVNWDNKPFWDCVEDLCKLAVSGNRFDCYADDDKDFHFFLEKSVENTGEAIVWNDTMISTSGLGTQSTNVKNRVIAYGNDGAGLPIISTKDDTASQTSFGLKEDVLFDTKLNTINMASDLAVAQLTLNKESKLEGSAHAFILPSLQPAQKIWISDPRFKIIDQYKIHKYTHKFPLKRTTCEIQTNRTVPQLFKKRIENELASQTITNPFEMKNSFNLTFDSIGELESNQDNILVSDGNVSLSSGNQGSFTAAFNTTDDITEVHLKVAGSVVSGTLYELSTNGGDDYTTITPEVLSIITAGNDVILRVTLNNANAEIDSIALLYK